MQALIVPFYIEALHMSYLSRELLGPHHRFLLPSQMLPKLQRKNPASGLDWNGLPDFKEINPTQFRLV